MAKKVAFTGKPKSADEWVGQGKESTTPDPPQEKMKRLTLDISESLHRRIKIAAAGRGEKIVEEIRKILEREYPENPRE